MKFPVPFDSSCQLSLRVGDAGSWVRVREYLGSAEQVCKRALALTLEQGGSSPQDSQGEVPLPLQDGRDGRAPSPALLQTARAL